MSSSPKPLSFDVCGTKKWVNDINEVFATKWSIPSTSRAKSFTPKINVFASDIKIYFQISENKRDDESDARILYLRIHEIKRLINCLEKHEDITQR